MAARAGLPNKSTLLVRRLAGNLLAVPKVDRPKGAHFMALMVKSRRAGIELVAVGLFALHRPDFIPERNCDSFLTFSLRTRQRQQSQKQGGQIKQQSMNNKQGRNKNALGDNGPVC